jgi:hypothetical protein
MDPIVVAVVSGVVVPIVAVGAWALALRSEGAADLLDRATGSGPLDLHAPDAPTANACPSCGTPYSRASNAVFCRHCGHRLKDARRPETNLRR